MKNLSECFFQLSYQGGRVHDLENGVFFGEGEQWDMHISLIRANVPEERRNVLKDAIRGRLNKLNRRLKLWSGVFIFDHESGPSYCWCKIDVHSLLHSTLFNLTSAAHEVPGYGQYYQKDLYKTFHMSFYRLDAPPPGDQLR